MYLRRRLIVNRKKCFDRISSVSKEMTYVKSCSCRGSHGLLLGITFPCTFALGLVFPNTTRLARFSVFSYVFPLFSQRFPTTKTAFCSAPVIFPTLFHTLAELPRIQIFFRFFIRFPTTAFPALFPPLFSAFFPLPRPCGILAHESF